MPVRIPDRAANSENKGATAPTLLANRPPISERYTTAIHWPVNGADEGPEEHYVARIWKTCEDGPTFHDLVAGPFDTREQAAAMLEVVRENSAPTLD